MAKLFNTQTLKEEVLAPNEVDVAIAAGTHAFKKGEKIPVIAPDGNAYEAPSEQVAQMIKDGFVVEKPMQTAVREYVKENQGIKGALKVGLGQFADEALMGIPELIANSKLDPLELAKKEALKKEFELVNNIAGVTGFGASLLYGGPVGKMAAASTQIGTKASASLAAKLAARGVTEGSKGVASRILAKALPAAAGMGVEGLVFSTPEALTEAALGDYDLAAETLLMNGLVGAGIGGSLSGVKEMVKIGKNAVFPGAKAAAAAIPEGQVVGASVATATPEGQVMPTTTPTTGAIPEEKIASDALIDQVPAKSKEGLLEQLSKKKANAAEIETAFKNLGLEAPEGALSASKFVQDLDSALTKKVSPAGVARAQKYQTIYDNLDNSVKESFRSTAPETALAAGDKAKEVLKTTIEKKYAPFKDAYKAIKEMSDTITVPDTRRMSLYEKMIGVGEAARSTGKQLEGKIKGFADDVLAFDRASDFEQIARSIQDDITAMKLSGQYEKMTVLSKLKETVLDFADDEIMRQARIIEAEGLPEAKKLAKDFIKEKARVKKDYAGFKDFLEEISDAARVRARGAGDILNNLDDVSSERLVDRLFDKKNYRQLEFIKKEMPELFEVVTGYKKNELLNKVIKDDRVQMGAFFREYDKLPKELREAMLTPEQLGKLKDAQTVLQSLPKDVNPSGTARGIDMSQFLSPSGLWNAIGDAGMEKVLKTAANPSEGLLYTEKSMKKTAERIADIPNALDKMFARRDKGVTLRSSSVGAISRLLDTEDKKQSRMEQYNDLKDKLSEYMANPQMSADRIAGLTKGLSATGAPTVAQTFNVKKNVAMQYIWDHLPKSPHIDTPFKKYSWQPTDGDLSRLERRIQAILQPMSLIDDIEKGTLTSEAVDAVKTVYPKVFDRIQGKILDYFMNNPKNVSYNDRVKLSLLLGQPLDPSLSPEAIQNNQKTYQVVEEMEKEQMAQKAPNMASVDTDVGRITYQ